MLCSSCGREVSEESSFCPHCGTSVERTFAAEPPQDGAAQMPAPSTERVSQPGTLSAGAPTVPVGGDGPTGLGGWLVRPIIGLFATPLLNILALVTTILPMREPETWARLTTPGSEMYHVLFAPLFYAEAIMACLFTVVSLAALPFVFRKSYLLPRLMIALYSVSAVWNIVDLALTSKVASDLSLAGAESWGPRGIASVVFAVIWVLYFLRSRRVKATFVRPWPASRGAKQAATVATVPVPQTDPRGPEMLPSPSVSNAASVGPVCPPPVSPEAVEPPADSGHTARPRRRRAVYIGIGVVVACALVGGGVVLGLTLGNRQESAASSTTTPSSTAIAATDSKSADAWAIGDTGPAGGVVFYDKGDDAGGWRYLEAAPASMDRMVAWGVDFGALPSDTLVGSGSANTSCIVAAQGVGNTYAAQLCDGLSYGGYGDWFLPSKDELYLMYENLHLKGLGGFQDGIYWSSSVDEGLSSAFGASVPWFQSFSAGTRKWSLNDDAHWVRAVRAFSSTGAEAGGPPVGALVRIGDTYVTQQQFEQRVADMAMQYSDQVPDKTTDPEGYKEFEEGVLEYMVTYQLAVLEAQSRGLEVTNEEVQQQIESVVVDYYAGDRAAFDEALASMGMTLEQLEQSYWESALLQKVYEAVIADPRAVSEEEITTYYDEHEADYSTEETRTARHILISPLGNSDGSSNTSGATADQWAAALATAQKVRADLFGGAEWAGEAAQYSDDLGTKDSGGELGVVSRGQMVQEFEDAVFSLDVGELSQPVKTSYGYHIVEVMAIGDAGQIPLDQVKDEIVWAKWIEKRKAELVTYLGG